MDFISLRSLLITGAKVKVVYKHPREVKYVLQTSVDDNKAEAHVTALSIAAS